MDDMNEQSEKITSPSVAIDGGKIRSIRETKKLTQLYVASVVGVTTDTISRWENNRYPSVKRDNVIKLAAALEVSADELLRQETAAVDIRLEAGTIEPSSPKKWKLLWIAVMIVLVAIGVLVGREFQGEVSGERSLPKFVAPGEVIPVQIKVQRQSKGADGFIVREQLPAGWSVVGSIPPHAGTPGSSEVKWLVPSGRGPVVISYTVKVPDGWLLGKAAAFRGKIVTQGDGIARPKEIMGGRSTMVGAYHWADTNGDGRIDDNEIMPAYYLTEEMKTLLGDWPTIESIWSGKGYRWDQVRHQYTIIR
jgi:transcriptional regulator with XRE-family HTH domain